MTLLLYILIFITGFILGNIVTSLWSRKHKKYGGTIVVNKDKAREMTVYSLELDDYPEELRFKKEVVFKIDASDKNLDRD